MIETQVSVSKLDNLKVTFQETAKIHQTIQASDKEHIESNWRDVINISTKYEDFKPKLIDTLKQHQSMWYGHLGTIHPTSHYIELTAGARPQHQPPYRAGPTKGEHGKKEVEKMLNAGVIEPSTSEWVAPVVLPPKKDESLRFCIDYRCLKAVTVRDSYPIPRMDECIDSLGDATIFYTLDCNSGYWHVQFPEEEMQITSLVTHHRLLSLIHI